MCFVCGLKNDSGLKARFYETERGEVVGLFRPGHDYQGFPNRLHGGICAAILDETMGRAIMARYDGQVWAVTVELTISYQKPVPLNVELKAVGRLNGEKGRVFSVTGEIFLPGGEVAVSGRGKCLRIPWEKLADDELTANSLFQPDEEELKEIDL